MTDFNSGLYFIPLGGADIIGMNMYVYGAKGKFIVVDTGYGFLKDDYPPMDMCYASPDFLKEHASQIEAVFITHAHEDHFGAIAHIWPLIKCPVYATPFATGLMKERFKEYNIQDDLPFHVINAGDTVQTNSFKVRFISLTHSVPETCGLFIQTGEGNVFHATDWRFDDDQMAQYIKTDFSALKEAADKGIDLFVCDSTNIWIEKKQPCESEIRKNLIELIGKIEGGIVATCFSSNLMRIESLILAADAAGRTPVLMGHSITQCVEVAKSCGYFNGLPKVYKPEDVKDITTDKALYICTGSQADYRSVLYNIANGDNKYVRLNADDTVIFSSKVIPGNEEKIERMQEKMAASGARILTVETELIHASGHASQEEISQMYKLLRPKIVFPVHGDKSFIRAHERFAQSCDVQSVSSGKNGDIFCLKDGVLNRVDTIPAGVIGVEFTRSIPLSSDLVKNRKKIAYNGVLFISAFVSNNNRLLDLKISSPDILEAPLFDDLSAKIIKQVWPELSDQIAQKGLCPHNEDMIKAKIRKIVFKETQMKPLTILHIFQQGENS